jgi:GTP pyrophosphokinase
MAHLLAETGERPDALVRTRERFTADASSSMGTITLDGSENASVVYSLCCRPLPGDDIVGYLGRGEGLAVHTRDCAIARKLEHKDSERFIGVEWSDELSRSFETTINVTVVNGKGVLARVAGALASGETDIVHVDMGQETPQDTAELKFVVAVRDVAHLDQVLRHLNRTPSVIKAERQTNKNPGQT